MMWLLTRITLTPSGFSAGVAAAVAAGAAFILLVPFVLILMKLLKRGKIKVLRWKTFLVAGTAVLFLIIFSEITSSPSVCGSCHAMRATATTWANATHKNIGCLSCHREKGLGGVAMRKLEDVRMLALSFVRSKPRGLNKPIRDEICLGCHANINVQPIVERKREKIRVSHREFVGQGIACLECHADSAHNKPGASRAVVMAKCLTCHNGKQVSADCAICHMNSIDKKSRPAASSGVGHGKDWIELHGVKNQGICTACHTLDYCGKCHREMPHPDGWSLQHSAEARKDQKACAKCHIAGESCINCHRLPLPHPAGWLNSHAANARQRGQNLCISCHLRRDCDSCHTAHANQPSVQQVRRVKNGEK